MSRFDATRRDAWRPDTVAVRAGPPGDPETGAVVFPVYQTSTFEQDEPGGDHAWCYARTGNPSRSALERALAEVEGARFGLAFASGLAAATTVLLTLEAGDRVVASRDLYGGAYRLFTKVFARLGVTAEFVDTTDLAALEGALERPAALAWLESPSNPLLRVTDLRAAAALAKRRGARVLVDNTFATPVLQRPLALGADLVLHSTTKYLGGHSDVLGGWAGTSSDEAAERLGLIQRAAGAVPGPVDVFLILRGIKTLAVRMDRHCVNAMAVAEFLAGHPAVAAVHYPGLVSHPDTRWPCSRCRGSAGWCRSRWPAVRRRRRRRARRPGCSPSAGRWAASSRSSPIRRR